MSKLFELTDRIRERKNIIAPESTEGCIGEQATLEFDLPFGEVFLHKLVKAYQFNLLLTCKIYFKYNLPVWANSDSIFRGWIWAPKRERRNDNITFAPKYYRCAENQSAEMTIAPKNIRLLPFLTFYYQQNKLPLIILTTSYVKKTVCNVPFIFLTTAYSYYKLPVISKLPVMLIVTYTAVKI